MVLNMRANDVLGIIYSNAYDSVLSELTNARTMGSVPFGGRYRLIDFALSNLVNCGINKVGIITKSNYQSLMDHIGTGKPWDLSRKRGGMFLLPPFNSSHTGMYRDRIQALMGIMRFLEQSKEEYIVLMDTNVVCNFDLNDMCRAHTESGADITIAYHHGRAPHLDDLMTFTFDEGQKVSKIALDPKTSKPVNYAMNIILISKALLIRLINNAISLNQDSFVRDVIQHNLKRLNIYGYEVKGFTSVFDSLQSYYDISMSLLDPANCQELFTRERPVYTKVRDDMPAIYGLGSTVKNSLVADGCSIDGDVENCILFRGVQIGKGAVVRNSIIMQGSYISEGVHLDCVIADKSVVVRPHKTVTGTNTYPVYIGKGIVI